ncbi:hypothetical protein [Tenuifilum sp.]|uniref:hypothetical protein n=1 Tax=Tenuifilum sp. TaxID=2760880 RepID=UPI002CE89587|nr:hypothetical protein [Tenuifilum sp.]HON70092.1 hypothetical protein [Tenuifilum sp.]HPP90889.1 hypothetical protein [Tenuifilum sp.]HRS44906.1 hypothetical protein [Tenuifilum sp.]HRU87202.1 hypothetical protein [Tenuifilum sp.]
MQLNKFCLSAFVILVTTFNVKAQEFEPAKDFGSEFGITGMFGKEGIDGNNSAYVGFTGAYFYDLKNGLRVGINRYYNFSGAEYAYTLPIYFAHRTKSSRSNEPFVFDTFGEFLLQLFTHIIPGRAEFNAGPVIGYFKSTNQTISNGYKLTNPVYLAANAKLRLTFQIWRFSLGGNFGASYVPSKNFYLVSPDPVFNGNRTSWSLEIGAFLSFSFD